MLYTVLGFVRVAESIVGEGIGLIAIYQFPSFSSVCSQMFKDSHFRWKFL